MSASPPFAPGRRGVLAAALGAALLPVLLPVLGRRAGATTPITAPITAPITGIRPPEWYRTRLGEFEVTAVGDGDLDLGEPAAGFPRHPREDLTQLLRASFRSTEKLVLPQNCFVVNTGRHLVLFDTGVGYTRPFGPHTGMLLANLRAAGISPEQIGAVVCSHGHIDHVWGIIGGDGRPNFPNARVFLSRADFDYWTDEARGRADGWVGVFVQGARRNLLPVRERITFVEDGQEVVPGVTAVSAPGHTVGHTAYVIQSGGTRAMFIGDLAHHEVIMLRRPQIEFAFDTDPRQSAQSRLRVLRLLAQERMGVLSYHFAFPGIGHVAAEGEGFGWYPLPWGVNL